MDGKHPITIDKAKRLVLGPLFSVYEDLALSCCAPLLWFRRGERQPRVLHNGTITIVRTPKKLFGVTAAHVVHQFRRDAAEAEVAVQIGEELVGNLLHMILDCPEEGGKPDLATIELPESVVAACKLQPLPWPPRPPAEGYGLLLAGFPGRGRESAGHMQLDWNPFIALATARTVTLEQVTTLVARDESVVRALPLKCDLGGISGGPMIGIFETKSYVAYHQFSGIIVEHPRYIEDGFCPEIIAGNSAEAITEWGSVR